MRTFILAFLLLIIFALLGQAPKPGHYQAEPPNHHEVIANQVREETIWLVNGSLSEEGYGIFFRINEYGQIALVHPDVGNK